MPQSWDIDRFFYFPSGGRHAEDFYGRKNPTASAGFEPANLGARGRVILYVEEDFGQKSLEAILFLVQ